MATGIQVIRRWSDSDAKGVDIDRPADQAAAGRLAARGVQGGVPEGEE